MALRIVDNEGRLEPSWDGTVASGRQAFPVDHCPITDPERHSRKTECRLCLVDRAMVFADVAGFSKLADPDVPAFLDLFSNVLARAAIAMPANARIRACGDEIFAVMENAFDVLRYALALNRTLAESKFGCDQMQPMKARIALHAGQIVLAADPVTGLPSHYGRNVNLAARLERVTEPGHVFATSDFVERLKQEQALPCTEFALNAPTWATTYLGTLCLPKNFGFQEVYEIRESGCQT